MDWFKDVPDFDPEWMADIQDDERRARKATEQTELMPHPHDFETEEEWEEAVGQYEFEESMILDVDRED